jgi:hypothetical protein
MGRYCARRVKAVIMIYRLLNSIPFVKELDDAYVLNIFDLLESWTEELIQAVTAWNRDNL